MTRKMSNEDSKLTIRDIEEKELEGEALTKKEFEALHLFRKIRLKTLKKVQQKEEKFHSKFEYFRELSSVMNYDEFLAHAKLHH